MQKQKKSIDQEIKELEQYIKKNSKKPKAKKQEKAKYDAMHKKELEAEAKEIIKEEDKASDEAYERNKQQAEENRKAEESKKEIKEPEAIIVPVTDEEDLAKGYKIKYAPNPKYEEKEHKLQEAQRLDVKFDNAKQLKDFINATKTITDEGNLQVSKEGLKFMEMHPSSVSMVLSEMPSKYLSRYNVKEGNIGLNLENLSKQLKDVKEYESARVSADEEKLKIELINNSDQSKREISVPILNTRKSVEKPPKIEFTSKAVMNAKALKDILKRARLVSDYIKIKTENGKIIFMATAHGKDFKEEYQVGSSLKSSEGDSETTFNLELLQDLTKNADKDTDIILNLKSLEPIKVEYDKGAYKNEYWLAPCIEE